VKVSQGADHLRLVLKHHTTLDLCLFQVIEGPKGAIGDAFIGKFPQALTGLQFRGIGRQEEQMDPLGHHQFLAGMPPSSIEHQQDPLRGTCSDRLSKVGECDGEHLRRHGRQQKPFGLASSRLDKTVDYVSSTLDTIDLQEACLKQILLQVLYPGSLYRTLIPSENKHLPPAFTKSQ
jgi:hypothetical protein